MKKIALNDSLSIYQFEPKENHYIGTNITILEEQNEIIIIDTGYEHHIKQIEDVIQGKSITHVICTHFHPDHCYGLHELGKQNLIGSALFADTLALFDDLDDQLLVPDQQISETTELTFHNHKIKLIPNKGHSLCGLLIIIDEEFMFVGDDIMITNDNKPILPYVAETIDGHIKGLQNIKKHYSVYNIIPAHGAIIPKNEDGLKEIDLRIDYLYFAKTKDKDITNFEEKVQIKFEGSKWHRLNIKR